MSTGCISIGSIKTLTNDTAYATIDSTDRVFSLFINKIDDKGGAPIFGKNPENRRRKFPDFLKNISFSLRNPRKSEVMPDGDIRRAVHICDDDLCDH